MHMIIPSPVTGYILNPERGFFSVILPEATTNLILNPSIELATTGYSFVGGSIARVATQQRYGAYSLEWTPGVSTTSYVFYQTGIDCVIGTTYTFSVDVLAPSDLPFRIYFAHGSGAVMGNTRSYRGTGRWQRVSVTYTETTASVDRYPTLAKEGSASVAPVYTDGWQVEAKAYETTYCDGDQIGFVPSQASYQWTGAPHASTSTRSAQTRAGGRLVNLDDYGFKVLSYIGLGMAVVSLVSTPFALGDGAQFQRAAIQSREFALTGQFDEMGLPQLQRLRSDMHGALAPNTVAQQQPLVLRYQAHRCLEPTGPALNLVCSYSGGLEGNTDNLYSERAALRFTQFLPYVQSVGSQGAALGYQTSVPNANFILQRDVTGAWSALGTGFASSVFALARTPDDTLYAGGAFNIGAGPDWVARYVGGAWTALTSDGALNAQVFTLAPAPDGVSIYVGGSFTNAGGVANGDFIAVWNSSTATWSALGTGANALVEGIAVGPDGSVYATGAFTTIGGVAAAGVAKWNGSVWAAMGTGLAGGNGSAVAIGTDGSVYVGGVFTSAGGVANTSRIAKWNGTAWSALGTGMNNAVRELAVGADGTLYAGGDFTTAGSVSAAYIAQWNGTAWSPLGSGMEDTVYSLSVYRGTLYAGGQFAAAGGFATPDGIAVWTGTAWTPIDVDLPGTTTVMALHTTSAGVLTVGWDSGAGGTATAAATTTVTNSGTAPAAPRIVFTGPGRVYQVVNTTTGDGLYFNLTLLAGETATLDLTPNNISFTSTFRGNILGTLMLGSQISMFRLLPGANTISTLISGTTTAATSATVIWTPAYLSVDDATE